MIDQKDRMVIFNQCFEICRAEEDCQAVLDYCQQNGMTLSEAGRMWEAVWADRQERFGEASIDNMIEAQIEARHE